MVPWTLIAALAVTAFLVVTPATSAADCKSCSADALKCLNNCTTHSAKECEFRCSPGPCYDQWLGHIKDPERARLANKLFECAITIVQQKMRCYNRCRSDEPCKLKCSEKAVRAVCPCMETKMSTFLYYWRHAESLKMSVN